MVVPFLMMFTGNSSSYGVGLDHERAPIVVGVEGGDSTHPTNNDQVTDDGATTGDENDKMSDNRYNMFQYHPLCM